MVWSLWKIEVSQTFKTELSYDLASPLLHIYLNEITMSKTYLHPHFVSILFTITETWKPTKWTDEWKRKCGIQTHIVLYY